jgi:Putative ATP-binding cassette
MIASFIQIRFRGWKRYFSTRTVPKVITVFLFVLIVLGISAAVFWGVRLGFTMIQSQAYGRETLSLFTYEVFFLVLSYLIFASAIVSGLFVIFRGGTNNWIVASPKYTSIIVQAGFGILASSAWTLLVIGIPAVIALARVYGGGAIFIPSALVALLLLTVIASGLAMIVILSFATVLYYFRGPPWRALRMKWLAGISGLFMASLTYGLWRTIVHLDVISLFVSGPANALQASINGIVAAFRWSPTNIIALMMLALQEQSWALAWIYIGCLALGAVAIMLAIYLFSFNFLGVWQGMQEGSFEARTSVPAMHEPPRAFPRFIKTPLGALFEKEMIVNFRSIRDSLWVLFILSLWILQTALNIFLRKNSAEYGTSGASIVVSIQSLQAATTMFFTSTFALRFALPSFSSDRRMAWIMGTAPIAPRQIFFSKLVFYTIIFLILGVGLGIVNASILGISLLQEGTFLLLLTAMIACVTTFGLSIGALFPDTESDDPERVSTSLPGLGFTFISLAYGGLGTWFYYLFLKTSQAVGVYSFIACSIFLIVLMVVISATRLRTFNPFSEDAGAA